jgi:hypothetical protein
MLVRVSGRSLALDLGVNPGSLAGRTVIVSTSQASQAETGGAAIYPFEGGFPTPEAGGVRATMRRISAR